MTQSCQRKLTIVALALYWPTLFILAHIPIPMWVRQAGVSDKTLHFLAYLILAFLLWSVISPDRKVTLRRAALWWLILVLTAYGAVDELLQGCMGRSCDIRDLGANLAGVLAGLILLSFFTFWPAALIVTGVTIFGLANVARTNLADLLPVSNAVFHLLSYAVFTFLWLRCAQLFSSPRAPGPKWLIVASALPIALLLTVKLFSRILGKTLAAQDMIFSIAGIVAVVGTVCLIGLLRKSQDSNPSTQL